VQRVYFARTGIISAATRTRLTSGSRRAGALFRERKKGKMEKAVPGNYFDLISPNCRRSARHAR